MEPLSIAAATMQFIDFASGLIARGAAIHNSQDGRLVDHRDLQSITLNLTRNAAQIEQSLEAQRGSRKPTSAEKEQESISKECQSVARELLEALDRLQMKGSKSKWKSFRYVLKATWNDEKVQALEKRLDRFRQQMIVNVLDSTRQEAKHIAREQESIRMSVEKMEELQRNIMPIGTRTIQGVDEAEKWQDDLIRTIYSRPERTADVSQSLNSATPGSWAQTHTTMIRKRILQKMRLRNMTDRERRIPKAYEKTFEWIFRDPPRDAKPWSNFRLFLETAENNIYWIAGKPGSGKSTLMKFVRYHEATERLLKAWAAEGDIIYAAFYFWNSGSEMQMSVDGLIQTILAECLEAVPTAVEKVLPERWEAVCLFGADDIPWNWQELSEALRRLICEVCPDKWFFNMIDGLDECSGDHSQLIELLIELSESASNLKLCVASRPWTIFEDVFQARPRLMLQDLTYNDIKHYVASHFGGNKGFCELRRREPDYADELLEQVCDKAEDVFLWVYFVVRSLLDGLTNGDRIRDLEDRLSNMPRSLEEVIRKILESLDPRYLSHASQLFQIVRAFDGSATLLQVALADMEDSNYALAAPAGPMPMDEQNDMCEAIRRRLISRCRGLLEITGKCDPYSKYQSKLVHSKDTNSNASEDLDTDVIDIAKINVQYLHRSVKDFIETPHVWDWIVSWNGDPFNVHTRILQAYLLALKCDRYDLPHLNRLLPRIRACVESGKKALEVGTNNDEIFRLLDEVRKSIPTGPRNAPEMDTEEVILFLSNQQLYLEDWWRWFPPQDNGALYFFKYAGAFRSPSVSGCTASTFRFQPA